MAVDRSDDDAVLGRIRLQRAQDRLGQLHRAQAARAAALAREPRGLQRPFGAETGARAHQCGRRAVVVFGCHENDPIRRGNRGRPSLRVRVFVGAEPRMPGLVVERQPELGDVDEARLDVGVCGRDPVEPPRHLVAHPSGPRAAGDDVDDGKSRPGHPSRSPTTVSTSFAVRWTWSVRRPAAVSASRSRAAVMISRCSSRGSWRDTPARRARLR